MTVYLKKQQLLGDKVLSAVLESFRSRTQRLKSGYPTTRSNGVEEWTVLASIVLLREDDDEYIKVLTLTTGVKAIPEMKLIDSKGLVLHDLHAEVLSFRAMNYLILLELRRIKGNNGYKSFLIDSDLKFHKNLKFLLYVSEVPCGDLSMELHNGGESWKRKNDGELVRGRAHFNEVGIIRTKPGRADSLLSLSKSCSDKIASRQYYGFCNALTALLLNDNFKLSYLVLPEVQINDESVQRCFQDRYCGNIELDECIKVVPTTHTFKFSKLPDKKPCDVSLVIISYDKQWMNEIIGKNGLKIGRSRAHLDTCSILSNAKLCHCNSYLLPKDIVKYSDLKSKLDKPSIQEREINKDMIRNEILQRKWVLSCKDDFYINRR